MSCLRSLRRRFGQIRTKTVDLVSRGVKRPFCVRARARACVCVFARRGSQKQIALSY